MDQDSRPKEEKQEDKKKERRKMLIEIGVYVVILATIYITFHYFLMLGRIPSESMEPTLMVHDWTVADRHAYKNKAPGRGDKIIFYSHEEEESMCKRVIGLPGEKVTFVGGHVYIDGEPLDESEYLDDSVRTECDDEFLVPEDSYFMLGDNREISLDSRFWDDPYIHIDDIQSKIFFVIPFHKLPWF